MGLILTIFTYNNDFLYKDKIIKIANIKTIMEILQIQKEKG